MALMGGALPVLDVQALARDIEDRFVRPLATAESVEAFSVASVVLSGKVRDVRPSVTAALCAWCLGFADQMVRILRTLGRLGRIGRGVPPETVSRLGNDTEEDRGLANAGLDGYARLLAAEDGAA